MTPYPILVTAIDSIILETFRYWLLSFFHNRVSIDTLCLLDEHPWGFKRDSYAVCMSLCFSKTEYEQTLRALSQLIPDSCTCAGIVVVSQNLHEPRIPHELCNTPAAQSTIATCMNHVSSVLASSYGLEQIPRESCITAEEAPAFTPRELEVLSHIAMGDTTKEISFSLGISHHTVVSHKRNLYLKTGARTLQQLALYAVMHVHTALQS